MKTRKRSYRGGRMGKLQRFFDYNTYPVIGAGHYGIIVQTKPTEVLKLLKHYESCKPLKKEAMIQNAVYHLFKKHLPEVKVPKLTYYSQDMIKYKDTT